MDTGGGEGQRARSISLARTALLEQLVVPLLVGRVLRRLEYGRQVGRVERWLDWRAHGLRALPQVELRRVRVLGALSSDVLLCLVLGLLLGLGRLLRRHLLVRLLLWLPSRLGSLLRRLGRLLLPRLDSGDYLVDLGQINLRRFVHTAVVSGLSSWV